MNFKEHQKALAECKQRKSNEAARAACNKINQKRGPKNRKTCDDMIKAARRNAEEAAVLEYKRNNPDYAAESTRTWKAGIIAKLRRAKKGV